MPLAWQWEVAQLEVSALQQQQLLWLAPPPAAAAAAIRPRSWPAVHPALEEGAAAAA
jgi:hypothetical protein